MVSGMEIGDESQRRAPVEAVLSTPYAASDTSIDELIVTVRLLSVQDLIHPGRAAMLKEEGNSLYKAKLYRPAACSYRRAIARALDGERYQNAAASNLLAPSPPTATLSAEKQTSEHSGRSGEAKGAGRAEAALLRATGVCPPLPLDSPGSPPLPPLAVLPLVPATDSADNATDTLESVKAASLLNLAACLLLEEKHQEAIHCCTSYLSIDATSAKAAKALYRRGKAHAACKDFQAARADLLEARELKPEDKAIESECCAIKRRAAAHLERERRAFSNAFGGASV